MKSRKGRKRKLPRAIFGVFAVVLIAVAALLLVRIGASVYWANRLANPVVYESESPTKAGTALFLTVGFQDRGDEFYVRDPAMAQGNPILVSLIPWEVGHFGNAVWSKDGSVIAVQLQGGMGFLHAYDFREHKRARRF